MHKLVSLSDDDRDRLIDRFWDHVTDGFEAHPGHVERLHSRWLHLPEGPATEQLEAWIELAGLVQDVEADRAAAVREWPAAALHRGAQ